MLNRRQFIGVLRATKPGYDVTVSEGRARPGGRVETLREGLAGRLCAETGATRVPEYASLDDQLYERVRPSSRTVSPSGKRRHFSRPGKELHHKRRCGTSWPLALTASERKLGRDGLTDRYLLSAIRDARPHARSPRIPPSIAAADRGSLHDCLSSQNLSQEAIEFFHIRGGNDRLPQAFADPLRGRIHYGCRSKRGQLTRSEIRQAAAIRESAFLRRQVGILKKAAGHGEGQGANDVFLQMRRQFWRDQGLSGFAFTDMLSD